MNTKNLHENIMRQKKENRYTHDQVGEALGLKKGGFAVKMERLKNGNTTTVSCRDIARMITLFECGADDLMKGVPR